MVTEAAGGPALFAAMSMGMTVAMLLVAAMVVVVMMIVVMTVTMIMVMRITRVTCMLVCRIRMHLCVPMLTSGIGAAFGIERRLDLDDARAEAFDHRLDDVIATDTQGFRHDLGGKVTIAEMPGDPDQMMRIASLDLEQRLRGRHHLDQPAILKHQRIAAAQRDRVFKIEQKSKPARSGHRHPPPVPILEIEHNRVGGRAGPSMLRLDLRRADHAEILSTLSALMISISVGEALSGAESSRQTFMCGARPCALRSSRVSQRSTTT